jgi:two-component system KDP operon response regulator KdpE
MLILIVDDEPQIRKLLQTGLMGHGYEVVTAADGEQALTAFRQYQPDLLILDLALGSGLNGLEVCRRLRQGSQIPIIILSVQGDERTKVQALNEGADDYLTKPFGMAELKARIQAVLRRSVMEPATTPAATIAVGDLVIDLSKHTVTLAGVEVHFTPLEFDILRLLATHPGQIMTHQAILKHAWGADYADMTHYVRIYINQIRKKLHEDPAVNVRYILNEPGIGYRFIDIV